MSADSVRRPSRFPARFGAVLGALAFLSGSDALAAGRVSAVGKPVVGALRAQIVSVTRPALDTVLIRYVLRWVGPNKTWIFQPTAPVNIVFWTPKKRRLFGAHQTIPLDDGFIAGTTKQASYEIVGKIPKNANAVSLALGTSGLETVRTKLP